MFLNGFFKGVNLTVAASLKAFTPQTLGPIAHTSNQSTTSQQLLAMMQLLQIAQIFFITGGHNGL